MQRNYMNENFLELVKESLIDTIERFDNEELKELLEDQSQLHHVAFNEDYFVTYHSAAKEMLIKCDYDVLDAVGEVQEWEKDCYGELQKDLSNYESVVNMLAYIYGESLIYSLDEETLLKVSSLPTFRKTVLNQIINF